MSGTLISNDRTAFDRFEKLPTGDTRYMLIDGEFGGFLCFFGDCWSWTVWDKGGKVLDGFRSWHMDAYYAAEKAIECIDLIKAIKAKLEREGGDVGREPPGA